MVRKAAPPRLWLKIDLGNGGQIGPGKIALLRAVAEHRSISGAARAMNMSYRKAWLLIDEMNRTVAGTVVATSVGGSARGGASVTARGRELIACYERLLRQAEEGSDADLARLAALASKDAGRG